MNFTEKLLYHIWDAQHILRHLVTVSGKRINIMHPGQWNTDKGPDFRNVIINFDGEVVRGDVEIHIKTYDWTSHGHSEDPNFNSVVLHVVYEHNSNYPVTIKEDGLTVEILELKDYLDQDMAKLIKKYDGINTLSPVFCSFFAVLDERTTALVLMRMGIERMERKVQRYAAELFFADFNQLLYQGIMEASGYSKNSYNMLQIAINSPYVDLQKWKREGMTLADMQSLFICNYGLKEHIPASVSKEIDLTKQSDKYQIKKTNIVWNLFRIRPVNHPVVRLMQISPLLYASLDDSILNLMLAKFSHSFESESVYLKKLRKSISEAFYNEFLPPNYRLGKSRIDIMIVNILIPVLILYGNKMGYHKLSNKIWDCYKSYPKLPDNRIEFVLSEKYMNDSQKKITGSKAVYQQGLLKLYSEFCRHHSCVMCEKNKKELILSM